MSNKFRNSVIFIMILLWFEYPCAQNVIYLPLTPRISGYKLDSCKKQILKDGDDDAYELLLFSQVPERNFAYNLLMCNEYNNSYACYCIYEEMYKIFERYNSTLLMDSASIKLAFEYLYKSILVDSKRDYVTSLTEYLNDNSDYTSQFKEYEKSLSYAYLDSLYVYPDSINGKKMFFNDYFQCRTCKSAQEIWDMIMKEYRNNKSINDLE